MFLFMKSGVQPLLYAYFVIWSPYRSCSVYSLRLWVYEFIMSYTQQNSLASLNVKKNIKKYGHKVSTIACQCIYKMFHSPTYNLKSCISDMSIVKISVGKKYFCQYSLN